MILLTAALHYISGHMCIWQQYTGENRLYSGSDSAAALLTVGPVNAFVNYRHSEMQYIVSDVCLVAIPF